MRRRPWRRVRTPSPPCTAAPGASSEAHPPCSTRPWPERPLRMYRQNEEGSTVKVADSSELECRLDQLVARLDAVETRNEALEAENARQAELLAELTAGRQPCETDAADLAVHEY